MPPALKTTLFVSVALAAFAGAAQAGSYGRPGFDSYLLSGMHQDLSDYASDEKSYAISKAAKAAGRLLGDDLLDELGDVVDDVDK